MSTVVLMNEEVRRMEQYNDIVANMNCFTCGISHMIETITIYVEKLENGILIVKNVPCKKCSQCGEEFFLCQP